MCAPSPSRTDKSAPEYHQKTYRQIAPFLDASRYGTVLFLLRWKEIADAAARRRAGLDLIDIYACGPDAQDPQLLHIHALHSEDRTIQLKHTYMAWSQVLTLTEALEQDYALTVPYIHRPKNENGLLACLELDGAHMVPLGGGYVTWTFKLKQRTQHRCPEETGIHPIQAVVSLGELGGSACAYCLADKLNINL